jgi:hypothetical protein
MLGQQRDTGCAQYELVLHEQGRLAQGPDVYRGVPGLLPIWFRALTHHQHGQPEPHRLGRARRQQRRELSHGPGRARHGAAQDSQRIWSVDLDRSVRGHRSDRGGRDARAGDHIRRRLRRDGGRQ